VVAVGTDLSGAAGDLGEVFVGDQPGKGVGRCGRVGGRVERCQPAACFIPDGIGAIGNRGDGDQSVLQCGDPLRSEGRGHLGLVAAHQVHDGCCLFRGEGCRDCVTLLEQVNGCGLTGGVVDSLRRRCGQAERDRDDRNSDGAQAENRKEPNRDRRAFVCHVGVYRAVGAPSE
jgi:hypothetical protein